MVYARTELDSNGIKGPNVQYYFYEKDNGDWEFTWDQWMNLANVDLNNFGNCEFLKRITALLLKIKGSSQVSIQCGVDGAVLILSQIPFRNFSTFKPLVAVGGLQRYKLENMSPLA